MQRKYFLFILLILFFQIVVSLSGTGSEVNPFFITNCQELMDIEHAMDKHYVVANDINCYTDTHKDGALWNYGEGFDSIGSHSSYDFSGSLVGLGGVRKISGIYINTPNTSWRGLFSNTEGALIKDLNIEIDMNVYSRSGGFVGEAMRTVIQNCAVEGSIESRGEYVGGLVGIAFYSKFEHIKNFALISGSASGVSGIAGSIDNTIINDANNYGVLNGRNSIGGIAGGTYDSNLNNCYNFGKIPQGRSNIGGIVGNVGISSSYTQITNCGNDVNITPLSTIVDDSPYQSLYPQNVGGLVGQASDLILKNSYNDGNIKGGGDVAGLVGRLVGGDINNCLNSGNIIANATGQQGGFKGVSGITNSSLWKSTSICNTTNAGEIISLGTARACSFLNTCQFLNYCSGGYTDCLPGDSISDVFFSNDATCHGESYVEMGWSCPSTTCTSKNLSCINKQCGTVQTHSDLFTNCVGPMYGSEYHLNFYNSTYTDAATSVWNNYTWVSNFFRGYKNNTFSLTSTSTVCENHCDTDENVYYTDQGIPFCYDGEYYCVGSFFNSSTTELILGDNLGLNKNTTNTLVESNTSEKCEYKCKPGYSRSGDVLTGTCVPYSCTGSVFSNSEIYLNDNVNLTVNTPITLVDNNSNLKCEYHCITGFVRGTAGADINKCVPFVAPSCSGSTFSNSSICSGADVNLTASVVKNLVDVCSVPAAKCSYFCNAPNYYKVGNACSLDCRSGNNWCPTGCFYPNDTDCNLVCSLVPNGVCPSHCTYLTDADCHCGNGVCEPLYNETSISCSADCPVFSCLDPAFSNSSICSGADVNLTASVVKNLVDVCSVPAAKCSYFCNAPNYYKVGNVCDLNCLPDNGSCPLGCTYAGGDNDCPPPVCVGYKSSCLVASDCCSGVCTSGVCEGCGNSVVTLGENCSNCSDAFCKGDQICNGIYFCVNSTDLNCGNNLIDVGESCSSCPSDVKCDWNQSCVKGICSSVNSISKFKLAIDNGKLVASVKCLIDTQADFNIFIDNNRLVSFTLSCTKVERVISFVNIDFNGVTYSGSVKINPLCDVCSKEDFLRIGKENNFIIADNSFTGLILILLSVISIMFLSSFKK